MLRSIVINITLAPLFFIALTNSPIGIGRALTDNTIAIHKNPSKCIDMVYDLSVNSLIESKKYVNIHEIDRLCDIIYDAKKLHFFGFQFNKILASDIQFKL
mgnify:CR=1 FL=1